MLTAGASTAQFATAVVRATSSRSGPVAARYPACTTTVPAGSGSTVSYTPTCTLEFDQPHTWRVRAVLGRRLRPVVGGRTFRTPSGGYIRGNEIYDPLTNGRTVGNASAPAVRAWYRA